jgi:3-deoxy-D-manno-octulosonic-acid transferase
MENFAEAAEAFLAGHGVCRVQDQPELLEAVRALLGDPARRSAMTSRASALLHSRQGATGRAVSALLDRLGAPAAFTAR